MPHFLQLSTALLFSLCPAIAAAIEGHKNPPSASPVSQPTLQKKAFYLWQVSICTLTAFLQLALLCSNPCSVQPCQARGIRLGRRVSRYGHQRKALGKVLFCRPSRGGMVTLFATFHRLPWDTLQLFIAFSYTSCLSYQNLRSYLQRTKDQLRIHNQCTPESRRHRVHSRTLMLFCRVSHMTCICVLCSFIPGTYTWPSLA